jgi:hypothetical protein
VDTKEAASSGAKLVEKDAVRPDKTAASAAQDADTAVGSNASDRPTLNADLSGLDHSAFSVFSHDGAGEPAIVPIAPSTVPATEASPSASPARPTSSEPFISPERSTPSERPASSEYSVPAQHIAPSGRPLSSESPLSSELPAPSEPRRWSDLPLASESIALPEVEASPQPEHPLQLQLPLIADETEHRTSLPHLSNIPSLLSPDASVIPAQQATLEENFIPAEGYLPPEDSLVSRTGSFAPLGATGTFAPVGEELLNYHESAEDIYVDDADDSTLTAAYGDTSTYAPRPQMTTMPESRAHSFFGNLGDRLSGRRKRDELEDSPSAWLGVADDFNSRKAGGEIVSWDNFSEDDDDGWKGGAYGGDSHQENRTAVSAFSAELVNHEVWFVALGSQEAENAGIKALLAAHSGELRNAMIINLDSVGAGDLCYTVREGAFRSSKTDHRLQSLAASASQSAAIRLDKTSFVGYQTDAAAALILGARAISIIGLDNALPVAWRNKADTLEILNEDTIQMASELVFEMIRNS